MKRSTFILLLLTFLAGMILIWWFIYKSITTPYAEDFDDIVYAVLASVISLIMLIFLFQSRFKFRFSPLIEIFFALFGTPLAFVFVIIYFGFFHMNFCSVSFLNASNGSKYRIEKFSNIFKTKNILIENYLSSNQDTLVAIIHRKGANGSIYSIKNGRSIELSTDQISSLPIEEQRHLLRY